MHACRYERFLRFNFLMRYFLGSLAIGIALVAIPMTTYAADLTLTPASATETVGQPFTVQISVDPSGQTVNAADGSVTFDPSILSVSSISKDSSAFSLWTADPTFSNSSGTITFSGGTPSGFAAVSSILSVTFTASKVGSTTVTFSKGSILAADGKGTNIYKNGDSASFTINAASTAPAPAAAAATDPNLQNLSGDPTPIAPQIASVDDPKSDSWYASSTADFYWVDTPDITGARIMMASSSAATPNQVLKGAATSTIETNVPDGVWYFVAQLKNGSGWGPSGSFKVQIDTTPPESFSIGIVAAPAAGGVSKFSFKTTDAMSGIDHYELIVGSTTDQTLSVSDVGEDGTYPIPPQDGGPTPVTINAYDKAGNVRSVTQQLTLPKVDKPVVASTDATAAAGSPWSLESVIIIAILMGIIGMQQAWIRYTRKGVIAERARVLTRVAEVRDTNDRVFSAMREEFEVTVNDFDEKPQLTPQERALLEHIKEVLDVSEEVIDSGIEDVKKMVRG
jgi:hypothetical protein